MVWLHNDEADHMTCQSWLPPHGRMACTACFPNGAEWGKTCISSADGYDLEKNPCSWGSINPRTLLLGFSNGTRQTANIMRRRHDDVAYAGFRHYLTPAMQVLGLLEKGDTIDAHIREGEPDWASGSLVRCGMAKDDKKSGTIIPKSTAAGSHDRWFENCTSRYLATLPPRLGTVVMLSNTDDYVDACFERIRRLHPETRSINDVSYGDDQVLWIHTVHFGGKGFNHINS